MLARATWILVHLTAALIPLGISSGWSAHPPAPKIEWPSHFEGVPLTQLSLSKRERHFVRGFPGQVGRFTDGEREIVIRWVTTPTRKLHPARDCLKGSGYEISPLPLQQDTTGNLWNCVEAELDRRRLKVCERIFGDDGTSWSDVSTWYWSAILDRTESPWWAVTVAQPIL